MQIVSRTQNNESTIVLSGRFDFSSHRDFRAAYEALLAAGGISKITLDMQGVEYLDSSALGMLLLLNEKATPSNIKVVISKPQTNVRQILEIANFNKLFTIT
jgi:anti-anti-sigma factor